MSTWLITGCSTGLGRALAHAVLERGDNKAVLPGMRARRSGAIVNVSSIGARRTPEGSGYYAAAKSALEGMSGSLRKELAPLGIAVTVVEPARSVPTSRAVRLASRPW